MVSRWQKEVRRKKVHRLEECDYQDRRARAELDFTSERADVHDY
jgi:hypothetical protein